MAHVMVLDDEPNICWAFRNFLGDDGHRVTVGSTAEAGLERMADDPPDLLFLDVRLPGMDGLSALQRFLGMRPHLPVVIMTAFGTMQTAVRAVKGGAFDYLTKPFDVSQARDVARRALNRPKPSRTPDDAPSPDDMVGRGPAMQVVYRQVALAAAGNSPVLILGESGTGKDLVARAIHQHGDRANRPFVPVHLAALPETLAERELFGHEKGAYTGADVARPGLFDRASGGTLFFDEVAEAPPAIQAKLLRVLDGGEYRAVGGVTDRRLQARVIAATNRDLPAWVRNGAFRADLFYRLAVVTIKMPPLRERREDIPALWNHFLSRASPGRHDPLDVDSPLGRSLMTHPWQGNVRELKNAAGRAGQLGGVAFDPEVAIASGNPAGGEDSIEAAITGWSDRRLREPAGDDFHAAFLREVEVPMLKAVRAWAGGNQAKMARRLGLHRTTLRQKLRQYGLDPEKG